MTQSILHSAVPELRYIQYLRREYSNCHNDHYYIFHDSIPLHIVEACMVLCMKRCLCCLYWRLLEIRSIWCLLEPVYLLFWPVASTCPGLAIPVTVDTTTLHWEVSCRYGGDGAQKSSISNQQSLWISSRKLLTPSIGGVLPFRCSEEYHTASLLRRRHQDVVVCNRSCTGALTVC